MRLKNVLITVTDMKRSQSFYKNVFGLDILLDNGSNVVLAGGLVLQEVSLWEQTINRKTNLCNNAVALYFEETNIEDFIQRLNEYFPVQYVTELADNGLGRRSIRFYDPDGHLIEVGCPITS